MFLELAEIEEPNEDIVADTEFITEDEDGNDDCSAIMNIDYIIIHRTLLYILNEHNQPSSQHI
jgi:hypothetical protein